MTYNLIHNVVPLVRLEVNLPLALSTDHPLQVRVRDALLAANPAILQFREMALEERNLVLVRRRGDIRTAPLDAKMVVHRTLVNGRSGLRDQLRAPHVAVPFRGAVDGDAGALLGVGVAGVLVRGRQVHV